MIHCTIPTDTWKRVLASLWRDRSLHRILYLALALRALVLFESVHQIDLEKIALASQDAEWYWRSAEAMIDSDLTFEKGFFTFGPGFASFLSIGLVLWGKHYLPFVLLNLLLSALSVVFIYVIASWLSEDRRVAVVAALLTATSYTSITLSLPLISDTLFFFLFGLGFTLFLKALWNANLWQSSASGIVFGAAILCRAIAQFWPAALAVIGVLMTYSTRVRGDDSGGAGHKKRMFYCLLLSIFLSVLPAAIWSVRNLEKHDCFALSLSGVQGLAKTVAAAVSENEGGDFKVVISGWMSQYMDTTGDSTLLLGEQYSVLKSAALSAAEQNYWLVAGFVLTQAWNNMTEISYYHRMLLPEFNSFTWQCEQFVKRNRLNYLNAALSLVGFSILIVRKRFFASAVLALVYLYYGFLCAFNPYQGSRAFYPGQYAWSVLVGTSLVWMVDSATRLLKRGGHK